MRVTFRITKSKRSDYWNVIMEIGSSKNSFEKLGVYDKKASAISMVKRFIKIVNDDVDVKAVVIDQDDPHNPLIYEKDDLLG